MGQAQQTDRGTQREPETYKVGQAVRHIDALRPHPDNPRGEIFAEDPGIQQLADDIHQRGVLEPLLITPDNLLLAGHRRRVAARVAAKKYNRPELMTVPVTVRELRPNEHAVELMLAENMQRQSLNLLEEARAFKKVMDHRGLTVMDLARRLAVPAPTVSARLAILKLPAEVQLMYADDTLPIQAAGPLARVPDRERQIKYANMVARRQLSTAQLKEIAVRESAGRPSKSITRTEVETAPDTGRRAIGTRRKKGEPTTAAVVGQLGRGQLDPTREEAVAALQRANGRSVKLFDVNAVLKTVCTACGMMDDPAVCRSCPLPRFVLGLVGRADAHSQERMVTDYGDNE